MEQNRPFQIAIGKAFIAFVLTCVVLAVVVIIAQYYVNKNLAERSVITRHQQTLSQVQEYLDTLDSRAHHEITELSQLPRLLDNLQINEATRQLLVAVMQRNPAFQSISLGQSNGQLQQLVNLQAAPDLRPLLQAEEADRWLLITFINENGQQQRRLEYFDRNFSPRHVWQHQSDMELTSQPWFSEAQANDVKAFQSALLAEVARPAQVYSIRLADSDTVLAVSAELSALSTILTNTYPENQSEIYLYPQHGGLIASNQSEPGGNALPAAPRLELTNQQLARIQQNPVLRVSSETDWPPLNFSKNGVPSGYAVDVLHYIARMTGVELQFVTNTSWQELATQFVDGELEIMQPVFYSEFRNFMGEMTIPFVDVPYGIITTTKTPVIQISELNGKTVAIPAGWSLTGRLQADFPQIEIIEADNTRGVFDAVISGKADAGMDSAITLQYLAAHEYGDQVIVHQNVDFSPATLPTGLHFMVNRQRSGMAEIMNRALENLSDSHHQALVDKWFNSINQQGQQPAWSQARLTALVKADSPALQSVELNQQDYYVYHQTIAGNQGEPTFLTILSPKQAVMQPVLSKTRNAALVAAVILLLLLPISGWFFSLLLSALKNTQQEIQRMQQRDYDEVGSSPQHLVEFQQLNNQLQTLAKDTKTYQQSHHYWTDSLIKSVAKAIDAKSAYPTRHGVLVPELSMLLAEQASRSENASFKDFALDNETKRREFRLAAWLHGLGKITTPEYLVDKRTKLEMMYNRIHEIRMRFEVLWRDAEIDYLQKSIENPEQQAFFKEALSVRQAQLHDDFAFIAQCNIGTEFMDQNANERLKRLAKVTWQRNFDDRLGLSPAELEQYASAEPRLPVTEGLLADKAEHIIPRNQKASEDARSGVNFSQPEFGFNHGELYNLTIESGTLTKEERFRINEHILTTIKMLDSLPYLEELAQIPRYATTYLETMNGSGYPRGLTAEKLSVPERILMLANVFEALTAAERPYKKAKTLSVAIFILHQLVEDELIDRDVFELFLTSGIYRQYAERFMAPEQIDEVDIDRFLREEDRYI